MMFQPLLFKFSTENKPQQKPEVVDNKKSPKITIVYDEQDSKYDGGPLIEPRKPYDFELRKFQPDKNSSML